MVSRYIQSLIFLGVYTVSSGVSQFTVNVTGENRKGLQLRGDILIKCYHRAEAGREIIFTCQFHTCAVADNTLSFTRQELDVACNGECYHLQGQTLYIITHNIIQIFSGILYNRNFL